MTRLLTASLLLPALAIAQVSNHFSPEFTGSSHTRFNAGSVNAITDREIQRFLYAANFAGFENSSLLLVDSTASPAAWHFSYRQQYHGTDIYGAGLKVNVRPGGRISSLVNNLVTIPDDTEASLPPESVLKDVVREAAQVVSIRPVYFPVSGHLVAALRAVIKEERYVNYELIVDASGNTLYKQDLNRYLASDSAVTAKVFLPDPLTTAGQVYGGVYADNGDADISELNNERHTVTMVVDFANDSFYLTSPYVEIQDFDGPSTVVATSGVPSFDFTRSRKQFEDVNCFYHISAFQVYMQSLGFNLVNYQVGVDAHALSGADNSMFNYPRLYFGDGCVDDAEDADVIIHEYGHAITASAAPGTWVGSERKALDEAAGDYLATSYSRALNPFNWELMFGWDGNNACWAGRTTASTKHYPDDLTGDIHDDGEIWSSTLMQIWEVLGRETADRIFLQSFYSYAQNISMTDAAYLFLDADSMLYGGANYVACYYWFQERGILPPLPYFSGFDGYGNKASCPGVCDASAVVIAVNGTAPFTYSWKDSLGNTLGPAGDTITGLCAGAYSVFITDASGDTVTVPVYAREPEPMSAGFYVLGAACSFCSNGTAIANINGGTAPFAYQWDDLPVQTAATVSALDTGYHKVTITDANGCSLTDSVKVGVSASPFLGVTFVSTGEPLCPGSCSGIIEAAAYSGTPPYTYLWNDSLAQTGAQATGLCAGAWMVMVTDSIGNIVMDSVTLSDPDSIEASITTTADSGAAQGAATVSLANAVPPVGYVWNDAQSQTTASATGLSAGPYTVSWVDANGCAGSATETVGLFISIAAHQEEAVLVYPNPASGKISFSTGLAGDGLRVQVTDMHGRIVGSLEGKPAGEIDLSRCASGIYHIAVIRDGVSLLQRNFMLR